MCTGKSGKSHKAKNSKTASGGSKEGSSSTSTEQQAGPSSSEQRDSPHTSQKGIKRINQAKAQKENIIYSRVKLYNLYTHVHVH
jgi:hypothetical protein